MNRSELIELLQSRTDLSSGDADWFTREFFETLADGLKERGRIELRGFGVFRTSHREQAGFQNPQDGKYYGAMAIRTIKFYSSSAIDEVDETDS